MTAQTALLEVHNVTKRFGDFTAVDRVSFSVGEGRIFGLLGPNGAGKTTTIRMIMNIIVPDEGKVLVLGRRSSDGGSRLIGYLPEERGLYRKMRVLEHIAFIGEIRGLDRRTARVRGADWIERLGLGAWKNNRVEELSKGMQQKIQLISAVIHDPPILVLDEPFSGLDPVNARVFKDLLIEYRSQGKAIVFSTHVIEQAEKLCDEIGLIDASRLVLYGSVASVKRQYSGNWLVLKGRGDIGQLRSVAGVRSAIATNGVVEVELEPDHPTSTFLREAARFYDIDSAVPHEVSLDEIFVQVVRGRGQPVESGLTES